MSGRKLSTGKLRTPEMHASFECDAYDELKFELCGHRKAENWALAKGCADALRAPGSSRPRHQAFRNFAYEDQSKYDQEGVECERPKMALPKVAFKSFNDSSVPPDIKKLRKEGLQKFSPLDYQMPLDPPPHNTMFRVWGRKWLIRRSERMPEAGLGLFAGELIFVVVTPDDRHAVPLFPYIGPTHKKSEYDAISRYYPHLRRYTVDVSNCIRKSGTRRSNKEEHWVVVGTPEDDRNLAGYINSNEGRWEANCMFEEVNRPPKNRVDDPWVPYSRDHDRKAYPFLDRLNSCQNPKFMQKYLMAVARRPIQAGEELFVDYPRDNFCLNN